MHIKSIRDAQRYIQGVWRRASHHANQVASVVPALLGAVLATADTGTLRVLEREGELGNCAWFRVGGARYAVSYNHDAGTVELRDGSLRGPCLFSFDNDTTQDQIRCAFCSLAARA